MPGESVRAPTCGEQARTGSLCAACEPHFYVADTQPPGANATLFVFILG